MATSRGPSVRWSESAQRWMAWVRFPDGSRRKVERVSRADAQRDLDALLTLRADDKTPEARRRRQATFAEVLDAWFEAGCPNATPSSRSRHVRVKSPNTVTTAGFLLDHHVRPTLGRLVVDRVTTERIERLFREMAVGGYATSTIDRTWLYLNQACQLAVRQGRTKTNPAADVLLPPSRPAKVRKSLTIDQARRLLVDAIPTDAQPAMWLTGLMCGLRPGELAGLRWPYVDLDGESPALEVAERALEIADRYAGQASPKTERGRRRLGLHPLLVAALIRHRHEQRLLGLYDAEGFVFCTRNRTPQSLSNLRRAFRRLCARAGLGEDWTTYELRHSFVSLVADQLDDLVKVADMAGHVDTNDPGLPPPSAPVAAPRHRGLGQAPRLARGGRPVIAVIDETAPADRGGIYYVVTAAIVLDTDATRLGLQSVRPEGRRRPFHWSEEGPAARGRMLDLLVGHGLVGHVVVHYPTGRRRQERARRSALQELVPLAIADGAQELIIESRTTREDDRDRGALIEIVRRSGAALAYRWEDKREPLLWVADALCGVVKEYLLCEDTTAFDRLHAARVLGDLRYRRPPAGNA